MRGCFSRVALHLIVYGKSFYAIEWEEIRIGGSSYVVSALLSSLHPSTMWTKRDANQKVVRYTQWYSPFTDLRGFSVPSGRRWHFQPDEIFYAEYPLSFVHPVKKSMRSVGSSLSFWKFIDDQTEGMDLKNKNLGAVKSRNTLFSTINREHQLIRAKISRDFHRFLDVNGPAMTKYYDLFWVVRYKKELNNFRKYLMQEFNKQVLQQVMEKNGFAVAPKLRLEGVMSNQELNQAWQEYTSRKIDNKELIERLREKH